MGSFEVIAAWWDERAGDDGDVYNRYLILPAVLRALGAVAGLPVLDLGCGNGLLSRCLAGRGARVTGVDISPTLIARAREREAARPLGITYLAADAAALPMLPAGRFAAVTANMVLMDLADAAGLLQEVGRLLHPGGRFVASLLHPCFEVPGGSDWLDDPAGPSAGPLKRIWRYQEVFSTPGAVARDQPAPIMRYHRPLHWYVAHLRAAGLLIDTLDEPLPGEEFGAQKPAAYCREQVVPSFLVLGAQKRR